MYGLICTLNAGGPAVLPWPKGVEVWVWLPGTAFFTPSEGTTLLPRLFHPGSVTVWRGESTYGQRQKHTKYTQTSQMSGVNEAAMLTPVLSVCRYDPQTDVWTAVAPMSISRDAVGVCLLGDRLFAVGGYDGQVYLSIVEAYDPQTNEWTQVCTHTLTTPHRILSFSMFSALCKCSRMGKVTT